MTTADAFDLAEEAPAKINLALHITGRRPDGYHLIDTLVTFTETGDRLFFAAADEDRFTVSGRFGGRVPSGPAAQADNLVVRALDLMHRLAAAEGRTAEPVHIHLEKNLPPASGIGGGSADAAATLRGLNRLWRLGLPPERLEQAALALGADCPMCVASRPLLARGIGEELIPLPHLPPLNMVLVNPLSPVATPAVFAALTNRENPPLPAIPTAAEPEKWPLLIAAGRNDLEVPALALLPEIGAVLQALEKTGTKLTRMSGSGASCFGLYDDENAATDAAGRLTHAFPDWFVMAASTVSGEKP
ncbi:4-(cytidine 5'-diphospho)-2-C-methyl-D-erythritol kinase [Martelella alba]|uniref:4-diphosphocytidyl-2-C-methyl-D-erythritol kinase n=1 Tax=Martelella alba TaxID=2590451 RepID=A0A506UG88_9HYPH|nr:4-(cytidine 5'-diphospho)-2-C-methyl-D-erythritol kinase [Martelella alba]TPW32391.1 4-(cytidine 5'-diphospho)-2-C-methyl-D-erythritol kinase [Martelella alba]